MVDTNTKLLNLLDDNWFKVDQKLKKFVKNKIKKILLINLPQPQTAFIDLEILKSKRYFNKISKLSMTHSDYWKRRFVALNIN